MLLCFPYYGICQSQIDSLEDLLSKTTDLRERFEILDEIVDSAPLKSIVEDCTEYQKEMDSIAQQLDDDQLRLETWGALARVTNGTMDMDSLSIVAKRYYDFAMSKNNSEHIAWAGTFLAPPHIVKGEFEEALAWFDKIESHALKSGVVLRMHLDRGQIYLMKGNLEKALIHLEKAISKIESSKYERGNSSALIAYQAVGYVYDKMGYRNKGVKAFKNSFLIAKEKEDYQIMAGSLINLASNLRHVDSLSSIKEELMETNLIVHTEKLYFHETQILLYLSLIDLEEGNINKAIQKQKNAKDLIESHDLGDWLKGLYADFHAKALLGKKEYKKAIAIATTGLKLGIQLEENDFAQNARNNLIGAYHATKNINMENKMLREYYTINDSIIKSKNLKSLAKLEEQIKDIEREREIVLLEKDKEILSVKNKQTRNAALGAGAFAFLALGFFFNARRKNKLISTQKNQLESLNNTKDRIFAIIGHDLRKPAISFKGISKKVKYLVNNQDFDSLEKYSNHIEQNALSLNKLTDNLLNWALTQRDVMPYNPSIIPLKELAADIYTIFETPAKEKNIQITNNINEETKVYADRNALNTILTNLIDNAIKYTPEEGTVKIEAIEENNGNLKIRVTDSGVGMDKDQINDIFLLKKDKSKKGTDGEKGTGLGLHLVKELVALNKGFIKAASEFGKGSSFEITLPMTA